jgi:23S rRNA (cytosine1962-C5)-methyltransferase
MPTPFLKLKANVRARVLQGHPWVFANEVEGLLDPSFDGEVVECRDRTGRLLGVGICNSRSQIVWRRVGRDRPALDRAGLADRLRRAVARRGPLGPGDCRRLVWSESDDLPGLVVDKFGAALVVQVQTLALERRTADVAAILGELLAPAEIIFRNDATIRRLEGLPLGVSTLSGRPWAPAWTEIDGISYWLDLQGGQKTGFYLDQRPQHVAVARHCAGKSVLDLFCNQGPFALHAAKAGASRVLGIDSDEGSLDSARRNAGHNGLTADFAAANVFDWLNDPARKAEAPWDVIILDPPPFAKSKGAMAGAVRGYKEINLRALQRLAPGGILATYSCSHHMQEADLREVIAQAAADARRKVRILEWCHQPPDHPVLVGMPESEYLRGYLLRAD